MNYKILALVILSLVFLFNLFLKLLEFRSAKNPIPQNVVDVYDRDTYKKWRAYHAEKCRLGLFESAASFLVDMLAVGLNWYPAFAGLFPEGLFMQMLAVLLLSALLGLLSLPFSYYDTLVIEEKYGFNRSTKKTFWLDQLKQFLISLVVMTVIGSVLLGVILVFALVMMALILFISFL